MMSSADFNFNFVDILKRKRIKLTLRTAAYIGTVQRINLNKTIILEEVVDVKNGRKIPGVKMFFGHEVLNVEMPDATHSGKLPDQILEGHLIVDEFQPYRKSITLDHDEDDEEDYINFVVIDEFHEKFGPAVMQIKKQQVIGVGADGVEAMQRLCWLQIATKNTVYLFDVLQLGGRAFKNGLSMILESKRILKVVHDCKGLAACLTASFGVKLTNVFDTQVADVLWFYKETGGILPDKVSTLEQVVGFHLDMPSSRLSSLLMKCQLTKEDGEMWYKRPCPVPLLKVMALSVIHLQPLRLVLLDALMKDYMALVDAYLTSDPGYPSNELDLPQELRDLERIREERYEMAIQMYPITDQGLLKRYNPRPLPEMSPPANGHQNQDQDAVPQMELADSIPQMDLADSSRPAMVKPISPMRVDSPCPQPNVAQVPATAPASDLKKPPSSSVPPVHHCVPPPDEAPGLMEMMMETMGRGRPVKKDPESSVPVFPSFGRGFPFHTPRPQVPKESLVSMKTPGAMEVAPSTPKSSPALGAKSSPALGAKSSPASPALGAKSSPAQGAIPKAALPGSDVGLGGGDNIQTPQHLFSQLTPLSRSFNSFRST